MSRKGQPAQTLFLRLGILVTLGHTRHVPLLPRDSAQQGEGPTELIWGDTDLGQGLIMGGQSQDLEVMVVIKHLVAHTPLKTDKDDRVRMLEDLQVEVADQHPVTKVIQGGHLEALGPPDRMEESLEVVSMEDQVGSKEEIITKEQDLEETVLMEVQGHLDLVLDPTKMASKEEIITREEDME